MRALSKLVIVLAIGVICGCGNAFAVELAIGKGSELEGDVPAVSKPGPDISFLSFGLFVNGVGFLSESEGPRAIEGDLDRGLLAGTDR